MTQEVHEFPQCFPKKLRHQAKLSTPASRNKFHVWGWAKRQNASRYTKSFMICCSSLLQILRDFVTQKMPIPCMHLCQCLFLSINKILLQTETWNCIKCVCFDHSNKMHLSRWSTSCQCRNYTEFFELLCSKLGKLWFNSIAAYLLSFYIDTT